MATSSVKKLHKNAHPIYGLPFVTRSAPGEFGPNYWHIDNPPEDGFEANALGRTMAAEYVKYLVGRNDSSLGSISNIVAAMNATRDAPDRDVQIGFLTMLDEFLFTYGRYFNAATHADRANSTYFGIRDAREREAADRERKQERAKAKKRD